jgi:hypothetical protein
VAEREFQGFQSQEIQESENPQTFTHLFEETHPFKIFNLMIYTVIAGV